MRRLMTILIGAALAGASAGCSTMTPEERAAEERREREWEAHKQSMNSLWGAGYGFNNPNPERRREGLEPVDLYSKK